VRVHVVDERRRKLGGAADAGEYAVARGAAAHRPDRDDGQRQPRPRRVHERRGYPVWTARGERDLALRLRRDRQPLRRGHVRPQSRALDRRRSMRRQTLIRLVVALGLIAGATVGALLLGTRGGATPPPAKLTKVLADPFADAVGYHGSAEEPSIYA